MLFFRLCIALPLSGDILDGSISKMIQHKAQQTETTVPIIVVFTKHDLSEPRQGEEGAKNDKNDPELAKRAFNQRYCHVSAVLNKYQIPYTLVSSTSASHVVPSSALISCCS